MESSEFEFEGEESATQVAANDLIQELENPTETVSDEQYMEDVDRRLDVASTYRQLLRSPLFESPTASTIIVETELREFVVQRLKILLNMAPNPVQPVVQIQSQFDEQELKTLKILLSSLAERAAKKAEVPSGPPQVAKAPAPVQPPQPPAVRRATAPASIPAAVPKQTARPVGRPPGPVKPAQKPPEENLVELEDPRSGQTILTRKPRRQVRSSAAVPMPRGSEMEAILNIQAQGSGAAMGARSTESSITSNPFGAQLVQNALQSED